MVTTPKHCPGWESFKNLRSFTCKCGKCGTEKEIFSDEFTKSHLCAKCGAPIDFATCSYEAGASAPSPR